MAGFNKKKNGKKSTKHNNKKKHNKKAFEDNTETNAPTATTAATAAEAAIAAATVNTAAAKRAMRRSIKEIVDSLAADKALPDHLLALQYTPTLLELFDQHLALVAEQCQAHESLVQDRGSKDTDAYLHAVFLTSQAERAQLEQAAVKRRIRRYHLSLGGPAKAAELIAEAIKAAAPNVKEKIEGLEVKFAAKVAAGRLQVEATKLRVSRYLAEKKEWEKSQSK
ncbi:hypothetical protein PG993_010274 [Apiospora rasikravindrae]|uniref:Uncharacterized protein n=1 Tax=Apiospora rasikravindrae TaxID=990691 RepID=A0ABR1SLT4_9PEZI